MARHYGGYYGDYYGGFPPYVSQAERRYQAKQALTQLTKTGRTLAPVSLGGGRKIATTFWGRAWCNNLERYSDYANRLPRGRSYVRNGSVLDLQIASGVVTALVSGRDIYTVTINVSSVASKRWKQLCQQCAGSIDSMIELLQGRFSKAVMEHLCRRDTGLFPNPREIQLSCSCPDWATMCKHVAAVLYGVGARLDSQPELLFKLRQVRPEDLVAQAGAGTALQKKGPSAARVVADEDLADVFGVELAKVVPAARAGRGRPAFTAKTRAKARGPRKRAVARDTTTPVTAKTARAKAAKPSGTKSGAKPGVEAKAVQKPRRRRRRVMTAAERKAVSDRMRRYWQERRKKR